MITSGVKQTLLDYEDEDVIPEAAWDRIAQYKVELKRVSPADARKILEARLERFHEPFLELDDVRRRLQEDTLFPLGRDWLEKRLGGRARVPPARRPDLGPRRLGRGASEARSPGGGAWIKDWPHRGRHVPRASAPDAGVEDLIDAAVDRKIEEQIAQHRLQPGSLPPDAGNLAGLVESLLGQWRSDERLAIHLPRRRTDREEEGQSCRPTTCSSASVANPTIVRSSTGVSFVTNVGQSATASLRRLLDDDNATDHRILVTDQERRPLKVGPQGAEYYRDLEKLGPRKFEHIKLDFEQYARLDALQGVIGMARSGDLEIESPRGTIRPVSEAEVVASHHRRDRFRQHPLLRPLLTEEPPPSGDGVHATSVTLEVDRVRQYIMAQLAWRMGSTAQALAKGFVAEMAEPKRGDRRGLGPVQGDRREHARRGPGPRHAARQRPVPAAEEVIVMAPATFTVSEVRVAATCPRISYFDAEATRSKGLKTRAVTRLWKAGDAETACGSLFHNAVEAFNRRALDAPEVRAAIEEAADPRAIEQRLRAYLNRNCVNLDALAQQAGRAAAGVHPGRRDLHGRAGRHRRATPGRAANRPERSSTTSSAIGAAGST